MTYGTIDVINKYKYSYNLKVISEKDSGIAEALNKGIRLTKGKYILTVQADDYLIHNEILSEIHQQINNEDIDMYFFNIQLKKPNQKPITAHINKIAWWYHFKPTFTHQGALIHKRVFDKIGSYDTRFKITMDYDLYYRAINQQFTYQISDIPITVMNVGGLSSNKKSIMDRIREEYRVQRKNEKHLLWKIIQALYRIPYYPFKYVKTMCFN